MTTRIIYLTALIISILGLIVVNERHIFGHVAILWLGISHLMFVFALYAGRRLLDPD